MKIRTDFVSNSSSSSYLVYGFVLNTDNVTTSDDCDNDSLQDILYSISDADIGIDSDYDGDTILLSTKEFANIDVPGGGGDGSYWECLDEEEGISVSQKIKDESKEKITEFASKMKEKGITINNIDIILSTEGLYLVGA